MNKQRAEYILVNKKICDIFYNNEPVWIQELNGDIATIGFLNSNKTESINVKHLNE